MLQQQEFLPDKARYNKEEKQENNICCTIYYNGNYCRDKLRMCQSMQSTGKLQLSPDMVYDFTSEDLQDLGEIGRGGFGTVNKMIHRISNTVMAVKVNYIYLFFLSLLQKFLVYIYNSLNVTHLYKILKYYLSLRESALLWTKENKSNY